MSILVSRINMVIHAIPLSIDQTIFSLFKFILFVIFPLTPIRILLIILIFIILTILAHALIYILLECLLLHDLIHMLSDLFPHDTIMTLVDMSIHLVPPSIHIWNKALQVLIKISFLIGMSTLLVQKRWNHLFDILVELVCLNDVACTRSSKLSTKQC